MAIVRESMYGNAKVYICDDMYINVSKEEMDNRKKAIRMAMGRIAASDGAAERFKAYQEQQKLEESVKIDG